MPHAPRCRSGDNLLQAFVSRLPSFADITGRRTCVLQYPKSPQMATARLIGMPSAAHPQNWSAYQQQQPRRLRLPSGSEHWVNEALHRLVAQRAGHLAVSAPLNSTPSVHARQAIGLPQGARMHRLGHPVAPCTCFPTTVGVALSLTWSETGKTHRRRLEAGPCQSACTGGQPCQPLLPAHLGA